MTDSLSKEQNLVSSDGRSSESSANVLNSEVNNVINFYQKTPDVEKNYSCGLFPINDGMYIPSTEENKLIDSSSDEFQKEISEEMEDWEIYMHCKENEERKLCSSRTNLDVPIRNQDCSNIVIQSLSQVMSNIRRTEKSHCNNIYNNSYNGIGEEDWDIEIDENKKKQREQLALEHRSVGNKYFGEKNYREAVEHYTKSLSLLPTTESFNNRAMSYMKLKNFSAAIRDANEVLKMEPMNLKALYRRGMARKEMRMFEEALEDIRDAMSVKRKTFLNVWNDIKNEMSKLNGKKYNICPVYGSRNAFEVDVSQLMVYANCDEPYILEVDKIGCTRSCVCGYCTEGNRRNRNRSSGLKIKERERWKRLTPSLLKEMNILPTTANALTNANCSVITDSSNNLSIKNACNTHRRINRVKSEKSVGSEAFTSKKTANREINELTSTTQLVDSVGSTIATSGRLCI